MHYMSQTLNFIFVTVYLLNGLISRTEVPVRVVKMKYFVLTGLQLGTRWDGVRTHWQILIFLAYALHFDSHNLLVLL